MSDGQSPSKLLVELSRCSRHRPPPLFLRNPPFFLLLLLLFLLLLLLLLVLLLIAPPPPLSPPSPPPLSSSSLLLPPCILSRVSQASRALSNNYLEFIYRLTLQCSFNTQPFLDFLTKKGKFLNERHRAHKLVLKHSIARQAPFSQISLL